MEKHHKKLISALSIVCVIFGILRALGVKTVDTDVLWFFAVSGLLLSIDRVREFALGPSGITAKLDALQNQLNEVEAIAVDAAPKIDAALTPPVSQELYTSSNASKVLLPQIVDNDDPQKGRFGGNSERNGLKISANVWQSTHSERFFEVLIRVESIDGSKTLTGRVYFYLHNTFRRPIRIVEACNGFAELNLLSYGAFTVGVLVEDDGTLLELDLSQDVRFPKSFRDA